MGCCARVASGFLWFSSPRGRVWNCNSISVCWAPPTTQLFCLRPCLSPEGGLAPLEQGSRYSESFGEHQSRVPALQQCSNPASPHVPASPARDRTSPDHLCHLSPGPPTCLAPGCLNPLLSGASLGPKQQALWAQVLCVPGRQVASQIFLHFRQVRGVSPKLGTRGSQRHPFPPRG